MANKKKKKTLKLQQYKRLPKYDGISNPTGYLDDSAAMFTPSKNYDSLANNTKAISNQTYGPGLNAETGDFIKSDTSNIDVNSSGSGDFLNSTGASAVGMAAQLAGSLVGDQSENPQYGNYNSMAADTMSNYGVIGQVAGAVGEVGGKLLKPDYDEYGVANSESEEKLYYQAGAYFDPLGAAENQDTFGEGVLAALLPGWGGENIRKDEAADAKKRKIDDTNRRNDIGLDQLNQGVVSQTGNERYFAKYGGRLPKMQYGGDTPNPDGLNTTTSKMQYFKSNKPLNYTFTTTNNTKRETNQLNTQYNVERDFNINKEEFYKGLERPGYLDSLSTVSQDKYSKGELPYWYQKGEDSSGNSTLNYMIPDVRTRETEVRTIPVKEFGGEISPGSNGNPVIRQYKGETHDNGVNGGIEVSSDGNPTSITNKPGIALVEGGEVGFNGYIFSNSIEYKK